jgi:hypothetical protein
MSISEHFRYRNNVFQSDIFVSDIGMTDVNVGCRISPILRSMSMPTYEYIYLYAAISMYSIYTEKTENGNFRLFSANGKWKFVFLGQQTMNGNRCLLFQQTCP